MPTVTKCETCAKEGKKSTLFVTAGGTEKRGQTLVYYDEEEVKHIHDSQVNYTVYQCSNKHKFTKKNVGKCPSCDWTGADSV